jgi:hypothetical protein
MNRMSSQAMSCAYLDCSLYCSLAATLHLRKAAVNLISSSTRQSLRSSNCCWVEFPSARRNGRNTSPSTHVQNITPTANIAGSFHRVSLNQLCHILITLNYVYKTSVPKSDETDRKLDAYRLWHFHSPHKKDILCLSNQNGHVYCI